VHSGKVTSAPAKVDVGVYKFSTISRVRVPRGLRGNRKAPDIAFPGALLVGVIYLIDPPVVGLAEFEPALSEVEG